jgi:signal transduction histidine kinase
VLDNQGIPVKYIGVRFEITEQVELQRKTEEQALELKKTFSQMIHNEKMATLGQLVAGVAHEINTPLGAINAAANNIADNFLNIIILFVKNLQIIEQNPQLFLELCSYLAQPKDSLSSREERQLKKKLTSILEENGIENAEDIASELAAIAFTINLEPYMTLFQLQNKDLEELLFSIGRTAINTSSIYTAVKKTQKIISALKSYSYQKNYDQKEAVDINDTLDNILTIYHNQIKQSIEVIREFQELPKIHVFVDEIGQVWNNLIVNALQAMKYQGRLIIQTYPETDKIVVKIIDNGPGIPKEIQDKIFEPFFTTKPQGEGTGLGLDICKKIVEEKHHGKIEVFSEPGCTCFTVTLPLEQN